MFRPRFYSRVSLFTALWMMVVDAFVSIFRRKQMEKQQEVLYRTLEEERDRCDFYIEHPQFIREPTYRGWKRRNFSNRPYGRKR